LDGIEYQFNIWIDKIKSTSEEKTLLRLKWAK